jgi:quercetin dioxygenase-like cupin family protein
MKNDKNSITDITGQSNHTGKSNHTGDRNQTAPIELEKSKVHIIVEIIEYVPNAVVSKTIIKKTTGNVTVTSFDAGEELAEKTSPFDNFIQIIDGAAEVTINEKKYKLKLGEGIVIPAHAPHCFNADEQFKMISTIIKCGYED